VWWAFFVRERKGNGDVRKILETPGSGRKAGARRSKDELAANVPYHAGQRKQGVKKCTKEGEKTKEKPPRLLSPKKGPEKQGGEGHTTSKSVKGNKPHAPENTS